MCALFTLQCMRMSRSLYMCVHYLTISVCRSATSFIRIMAVDESRIRVDCYTTYIMLLSSVPTLHLRLLFFCSIFQQMLETMNPFFLSFACFLRSPPIFLPMHYLFSKAKCSYSCAGCITGMKNSLLIRTHSRSMNPCWDKEKGMLKHPHAMHKNTNQHT